MAIRRKIHVKEKDIIITAQNGVISIDNLALSVADMEKVLKKLEIVVRLYKSLNTLPPIRA